MWEFTPEEFQSSYDDGYLHGMTINADLSYNPYKRHLNRERHYYWNSGLFDGRKKYLSLLQSIDEEMQKAKIEL